MKFLNFFRAKKRREKIGSLFYWVIQQMQDKAGLSPPNVIIRMLSFSSFSRRPPPPPDLLPPLLSPPPLARLQCNSSFLQVSPGPGPGIEPLLRRSSDARSLFFRYIPSSLQHFLLLSKGGARSLPCDCFGLVRTLASSLRVPQVLLSCSQDGVMWRVIEEGTGLQGHDGTMWADLWVKLAWVSRPQGPGSYRGSSLGVADTLLCPRYMPCSSPTVLALGNLRAKMCSLPQGARALGGASPACDSGGVCKFSCEPPALWAGTPKVEPASRPVCSLTRSVTLL